MRPLNDARAAIDARHALSQKSADRDRWRRRQNARLLTPSRKRGVTRMHSRATRPLDRRIDQQFAERRYETRRRFLHSPRRALSRMRAAVVLVCRRARRANALLRVRARAHANYGA